MFDRRTHPKATPIRRGRIGVATVLAVLTMLSVTGALMVATAGSSSASTLNGVATPDNPSTGNPVGSGGSDTTFTLNLGTDPVCSGDSATDGYRVWSYLVKPTVKISSITFNQNTNASEGYGLYTSAGEYFGDANTAQTTGEVLASQTQIFEWGPAVIDRGLLKDLLYTGKKSGIWEGGLACANSSGVLTDNWNVQFTFAKSTTDPNGFTWTDVPGPPAPLGISTTSLPAATIGTAYSTTVTASGGTPPYAWKATGLPKPLKINKTTGVISGKPATTDAAKTYSVAVTVTDKAKPKGTATKTLSLVLNAA